MRGLQGTECRWLLALVAVMPFGFAGRAAADDADDDARPLLAAVEDAVANGRLTQSKILGFNLGKAEFNEAPDDPGVLIGFDLGMGKFFDAEMIYGLRAVFQTKFGEVTLKDHGRFKDKVISKNKVEKTKVVRVVHVRARPGYAVGGITVRSGLLINGLSVTFMRIHGRTLDPNQSYVSEWIGDRTGGNETYVGGDGAPVVGLIGSQDDEKISAVGLSFTNDPAPAVAPPIAAPAPVQPPVVRPAVPPPAPAVQPPDGPPRNENPAPPPAVAPAAPPQEAPEPATAPTKAFAPTAAPTAPPSPTLLTYILPVCAFLAVAGFVAVFAVASVSRKTPPVKRDSRKPNRQQRRPSAAVPPPTGLYELPTAIPVNRPRSNDEKDVLELGPDDFEVISEPPLVELADAPNAPPPSSSGWPRLEV